jgi:hypothetical protein
MYKLLVWKPRCKRLIEKLMKWEDTKKTDLMTICYQEATKMAGFGIRGVGASDLLPSRQSVN